ncbi:Conserved_hypothetical protein [Hexamita inflata]|uniref:Uncharacterized protein n=1 Tax=Hexamita inflata TaxID=28002 RepID=A0ABP1GKI9_9EUKA
MLFIHICLLDLTIEDKTELVDCYNSSSYIRLVTVSSKRYYRLYLTPTNKTECYQIPRGINVTVFANALVDANGNFIPTSYILVNFSYATTIGINILCQECSDDSYLSSDQVIVTIESTIHFTRVVMGSVLTEKGLQVNCFQSSRTILDIDYIELQVSSTNNCPQLISLTNPNNMKNLIQADVYIIYLSGDIDRYEKLVIGTDFQTLSQPPSWDSTNIFNATISNIGSKPLQSSIQFIQFQLYFDSVGTPLIASIQVNNYNVISLQNAYSSIKLKVQGASAYLDLEVNTTTLSSGLQVYQDYNNQITALQADSVQIQFFGYSNRIPSAYVLDGTQITSSASNTYQEPSMSFTMTVNSFLLFSGRVHILCTDMLESDCESNLKRYATTNDSTFQFDLIIRFFKNGSLVKAMNQNVGAATESCFNGAIIKVQKQTMQITLGQETKMCSITRQVNLVLNLIKTDLNTETYQQINSTHQFAYSYSIPLSTDQFSNLESYLTAQNDKSQMLMFYEGDVLMDFVSIDEIYISKEDQFHKESKFAILTIGLISVLICTCITLAPTIKLKVTTITQRIQFKRIVPMVVHDDL